MFTFKTPVVRRPLTDFFEYWPKKADGKFDVPRIGRAWKLPELRLKSFEDLHKMWYVCLKEKNMLYTEKEKIDKNEEKLVSWMTGRTIKVKKTMARIKMVVAEREKYNKYLKFNEYKNSLEMVKKLRLEKEAAIKAKIDAGQPVSFSECVLEIPNIGEILGTELKMKEERVKNPTNPFKATDYLNDLRKKWMQKPNMQTSIRKWMKKGQLIEVAKRPWRDRRLVARSIARKQLKEGRKKRKEQKMKMREEEEENQENQSDQ